MSLFDSASLIVTPNGVKEDKLYSIKPSDGSGDLVVTRATTATRVNSEGLIEQVPYNLLTYSEQFNNAIWAKNNATITANSTTAPNDTLTADSIFETTANGVHIAEEILTNASAGNLTFSCYLKKGTRNFGGIRAVVNNYSNRYFALVNLETGQIVDTNTFGSGVTWTSSVEVANNDFYRLIITGVHNGTGSVSLAVSSALNSTPTYFAAAPTFIGSASDNIFVWGAQLVTGTSAKEYFPTTDRLDVPRLDYTNSTCPSILVEPQRTNLVTYSEDFTNASWTKTDSTITANSTTAPNGTLTADSLIENTSTNVHRAFQTLAVTGTHTYSFYVKANGRQWIAIGAGNTSSFGALAYFDIQNGVLGTVSVGSANIQNAGNGWFRCSVTGIGNGGGTSFNIWLANANNSISYLGNGTSGVYLWGAQLEAGSNATSYVPTVASSVTRNADVISKTGISSLIGQTEGTLFTDFKVNSLANFGTLISVNSNSLSNFIYVTVSSSGQLRVQVFNGSIQADIYSSVVVGNRYKLAFGYKTNDFVLYINGVLIGSDVSGTTFSGTTLDRFDYNITIPNTFANSSVSINSSALWKERLTNTELAQLTTI